MRLNFKKVSAIAASALMVGMTMGVAAAANYPQPFVAGGAADVAIVYGTGSGVSTLDLVQAGNIQSNLQAYMGASDGSTTVTGGDYWEVGTSSDKLELGEPIHNVETYIGKEDLSLLSDQTISNEKGEAAYSQYFYFDNPSSQSVIYAEDDDDNIGLFFKINSGQAIARYVMDFTTNLKSDIETTGELSDIEDKLITFLGKTYTIIDATNGTAGVELTLMSGALGGTVSNDEVLTVGNYQVSTVVSSGTAAKFTIVMPDGTTEATDKMNKGDMEKLSDGNYLSVTDLTYEAYADGLHTATFYIGADKIEWKNGSSMSVNSDTISDAAVSITQSTASGDLSISEISINMTAEDDLYVPANGKLSQAPDLSEPEVLVSQNWDIEYKGLEAVDYETISLKASESDRQYVLRYLNYEGNEVVLPLMYTNGTGWFGGDSADERLVLMPDNQPDAATGKGGNGNITYKDYFLLHTADPTAATNNAKTILVQYKGSDKASDTSPKVHLLVNPGPNQEDYDDISLSAAGAFTLKIAGGTFNFKNESSAESKNFNITLNQDSFASGNQTGFNEGNGGFSVSNYIRTYYNTLINLTDTNTTNPAYEGDCGLADIGCYISSGTLGGNLTVNVTVDDANRDGDQFTIPTNGSVFWAAITNGSNTGDAVVSLKGIGNWISDPDNTDVQKYVSAYGVDITSTDPTDSPVSIETKIPKSIVRPLVYVTQKDGVVVSSTTGGATSLGEVLVTDSEVSSVSSKNLIVVGGSCINSVAASLLGSGCGSDFTDTTGIGSGQFLIQSLTSTYSSSKVALVVAGYEAADTVNAATYLRTQTVDTTAGKKYKGTSATSAELVTTAA